MVVLLLLGGTQTVIPPHFQSADEPFSNLIEINDNFKKLVIPVPLGYLHPRIFNCLEAPVFSDYTSDAIPGALHEEFMTG